MQHLREELDELNAAARDERFGRGFNQCSVNAVVDHDHQAAQKVFENEDRINELEILIDNIAIRLLALQQPVAVDLRFVTMSIKINNNLERMGDIAVNIAQRAISLLDVPSVPPNRYPHMSKLAEDMIRNSIDAFLRRDADLARRS